MKTIQKGIKRFILFLVFAVGAIPLVAFGQSKFEDHLTELLADDQISAIIFDDDEPDPFTLPDFDEFFIPDPALKDQITPFDEEFPPDPATMERMELAIHKMYEAMRRFEHEIRRFHRFWPQEWEMLEERMESMPPLPRDPKEFMPHFFPKRPIILRKHFCTDREIDRGDTIASVTVLRESRGDTVIRKIVRVITKERGKDADTVVTERLIVPSKHFSRPERYWKTFRIPGPLKAVDLSQEDLNKLAKSALAPYAPADPLGIPEVKIRPFSGGVIQIAFPARNLSSFDISIFDENGELIFQESIKKNAGDYARRIEIDRKPPFYLKINQGKKSLIKKIIPDR